MKARLTLSAEPVLRFLVHAMAGMIVSGLAFSAGWFTHYSINEGIPGAIERFKERMEWAIDDLCQYPFFRRVFEALLKAKQEEMGFPLLKSKSA